MEYGSRIPRLGQPTIEPDVKTGALVRRILIDVHTATGVEYELRGRRYTATAEREIVLCAGSFGTPHLLQLSGIGPADHLCTFMNWELRKSPRAMSTADVRYTTGIWSADAVMADLDYLDSGNEMSVAVGIDSGATGPAAPAAAAVPG